MVPDPRKASTYCAFADDFLLTTVNCCSLDVFTPCKLYRVCETVPEDQQYYAMLKLVHMAPTALPQSKRPINESDFFPILMLCEH